jgi:hypothetical protein
MRPTSEIQSALDGSLSPDELAPASLSSLRFTVYQIACVVLKTPGNETKRQIIESYPKGVQPLLRAECRRIYDLRRGKR